MNVEPFLNEEASSSHHRSLEPRTGYSELSLERGKTLLLG